MSAYGHGSKFFRSPDAGATYVQCGRLMNVEPPEISRDSVETTEVDQGDDNRRFEPGPLIDNGEYKFDFVWDRSEAQQQLLEADASTKTNQHYRIEYPLGNGVQVDFQGHITSMGKTWEQGERMLRTFTIKVSGSKTVTDL